MASARKVRGPAHRGWVVGNTYTDTSGAPCTRAPSRSATPRGRRWRPACPPPRRPDPQPARGGVAEEGGQLVEAAGHRAAAHVGTGRGGGIGGWSRRSWGSDTKTVRRECGGVGEGPRSTVRARRGGAPRDPTSPCPGPGDEVARQEGSAMRVAAVGVAGGDHQRCAVGPGVGEVSRWRCPGRPWCARSRTPGDRWPGRSVGHAHTVASWRAST